MSEFPFNLYQDVFNLSQEELDEISGKLGKYQMIASVYAVMSKLTPRESEIMLMHYKDGMGYADIAKVFDRARSGIWYKKNDTVRKIRRWKHLRKYLLKGIMNCEKELLDELDKREDLNKGYRYQIRELIRRYDPNAYEAGARTVDDLENPEIITENLERQKTTYINTLQLSTRAYNCLAQANIYTVGDLLSKSYTELLRIHGMGRKSLDEIVSKITDMGFSLAKEEEDNYGI